MQTKEFSTHKEAQAFYDSINGDAYITSTKNGKWVVGFEAEEGEPAVYAELVKNAERISTENSTGKQWGCVYLDNLKLSMSKHQLAGYLSSLTAKGLYKPIDGVFGDVLLPQDKQDKE